MLSQHFRAQRLYPSIATKADERVGRDRDVRQWVLSLPFELWRLVAFRADVLTGVARIFYETVSAYYRRHSGIESARTGAVTCVQRFGGSLNLNPHLHVIWLDGVLSFSEKGTARFHPAVPPSHDDLERIVAARVVRWLDRKGLLDLRGREERPDVPEAPTSLEVCTQVAFAPGDFGTAGPAASEVADHTALVFPIDNSVASKNVEVQRFDTLFQVPSSLKCDEPTGEPGRVMRSEELNAKLHDVEESAGQALETEDAANIDSVMVKTTLHFVPSGRFCAAVRLVGSEGFEFLPGTGDEPVFSHATETAMAELPIGRYCDAVAILFEDMTQVNEITVRKK